MSGFRVLLVDDEEELVSTLVERLDYRGVSAEYAVDGEKALEMLQKVSFDVVVVDLKLPGMSGEELLHIIRKAYPHLPVLMITGHGSGDKQEYDKPEGAYDFLPKPIDISELLMKMKEAIKANE
ncbi:MAG: response regulator [bacterium]